MGLYLIAFELWLLRLKITTENGAIIEYLDTNELENSMVAMTIADLQANSSKNNYYY